MRRFPNRGCPRERADRGFARSHGARPNRRERKISRAVQDHHGGQYEAALPGTFAVRAQGLALPLLAQWTGRHVVCEARDNRRGHTPEPSNREAIPEEASRNEMADQKRPAATRRSALGADLPVRLPASSKACSTKGGISTYRQFDGG